MNDVLVLVDVLNHFEHEDGDSLRGSFHKRVPNLVQALDQARGQGTPVVFVNDHGGSWSADRSALIQRALSGPGGEDVISVLPRDDEPLLVKARYSAFDHTPLMLLLEELGTDRLLLGGMATEGCVVQTGIDGRELGFKVTILTAACATADEEREEVALRYAEQVAGIHLAQRRP